MSLVQNKLILSLKVLCVLTVCVLTLVGTNATAQEIDQFTESDLPTESVMPLVDYPEMVLNKNVTFTNKWSISGSYARVTDEMFFNNNLLGVRAGFGWNEFSSAGLIFQSWGTGLSDYSKVFQANSAELRVDAAPLPQSQFFLYFEQQYFYGKISLAKELVNTFVFLGRYSGGLTKYETASLPHLNYTLGYQAYLTKNFFVELTLGLSVHQAYNPVGVNIRTSATDSPVNVLPAKTDFPKKVQFSQTLNLAAGLLF